MITETLIALSIIAAVFVYIGLKSESTLLRTMFISVSLLIFMTFFYQMGLLYASYQNIAPQYQLVIANTTTSSANVTTYKYISEPIVNTTILTGYKQSAMNGISQVWFDWAMVMGFILVIYILIEIIAYKFIGGISKQMQRSVK
jgi:hypothetical protein